MTPCDQVSSALKAVQTEIENLTKDIDKVLNTAQSYVDAVSNTLSNIQDLISNAACTIAKYMKIVFDKIKEYVLKQINNALAPTVELLPPNMRYMYADIKATLTETINCLYNNMVNNLCGLIQGLLDDQLQQELPPSQDGVVTTPSTQICGVETLTGDLIALNMDEMNTTVNSALDGVNNFLTDIQSQIGTVSSAISSGQSFIDDISGSITSALSFENIKLNIFGCDLKPNCAASDYYTLASGSGAAQDAQQPRASQVDKAAQESTATTQATQTSYALPSQNQPDIDLGTRGEAIQAVESGQVTFA